MSQLGNLDFWQTQSLILLTAVIGSGSVVGLMDILNRWFARARLENRQVFAIFGAILVVAVVLKEIGN